jgi:carbon-monoxide dehydrogenase small subunit
VQQAFVDAGAVQVRLARPGCCRHSGAAPADAESEQDEIREALSGNLCRCTGYMKIFDAVRTAAAR